MGVVFRHSAPPGLLAFALVFFGLAQLCSSQERKETEPSPSAVQKKAVQEKDAQPSTNKQEKKESPGKTAAPSKTGTTLGDEPVLITTDLISFNVTVTDIYGRFVSGLPKSAFTVVDEKVPQEITFFSDDDAPVSVGIVYDVSGSMSGEKIRRSREALAHFLETSHQQDEYFLIGFNQRVQLLLDKTRDSKAILDKLMFVNTHGTTAFYDACYVGVEKVQRGTHPKRALLVISDGQDNNSRYTFSDLRRQLKESDVIVYGIGIEGRNDGSLGMEGESILTELASVSGGKAFFPNTSAEMDDVFERIAVELRHQYAIGYKPTNFTADGKWHRIKVKIHPPRGLPHLSVRSKDGYYALTTPR
jgi:Ca-activated chloride channel family protein